MTKPPRSSTHARQRSKNLFFLIALLLLVAGFFYLSILKTAEQQVREESQSQDAGKD